MSDVRKLIDKLRWKEIVLRGGKNTTERLSDAAMLRDAADALEAQTKMIRTAKAEAWREGAESAFFDPDIRGYVDYPNNPYK